jgi:hypothetical protein
MVCAGKDLMMEHLLTIPPDVEPPASVVDLLDTLRVDVEYAGPGHRALAIARAPAGWLCALVESDGSVSLYGARTKRRPSPASVEKYHEGRI